MHIMYCCCRRRGMPATTQPLAVSALRVARNCNVIFRPLSTFVASFPELPLTSTHGYSVQQSINCCQHWNFVEAINTEMVEEGFHCRCPML